MADGFRPTTFDNLPSDLILKIFTTNGRLCGADLASLELTCTTFRETYETFRSLAEFAAFQLCQSHPIHSRLNDAAKENLFIRCKRNWKQVWRFLQSVEQSSSTVQTSAGNIQVKARGDHTFIIKDKSVYSCGSTSYGNLGHCLEKIENNRYPPGTQDVVGLTRISFAIPDKVVQVSTSTVLTAFLTQSGQVYTCGTYLRLYHGNGDGVQGYGLPRLVKGLKGIPCKQVEVSDYATAFLTRDGHAYFCRNNLLHSGEETSIILFLGATRKDNTMKEPLGGIVQVSCGTTTVLALTSDGTLYSFNYGKSYTERRPRVMQFFKKEGIHIVSVSAGKGDAVAIDSNGLVYTWYTLSFSSSEEEVDSTRPIFLKCLKSRIAVQVYLSETKKFILMDDGSLYGFRRKSSGSPGLLESKRKLYSRIPIKSHHISQVCSGYDHTVVVTNRGQVLGFGDNELAQLGHDPDILPKCLRPTELCIPEL